MLDSNIFNEIVTGSAHVAIPLQTHPSAKFSLLQLPIIIFHRPVFPPTIHLHNTRLARNLPILEYSSSANDDDDDSHGDDARSNIDGGGGEC